MRISMTFLILIFAVIISSSDSVLANGGKSKNKIYFQTINVEQGVYEFSSEINPVMFNLNSVHGKYKVIAIKIKNRGKKTLLLSKEKDKIELVHGGDITPTILDLSKHDPGMWDAFDAAMRNVLVYPQQVEAGEEENIYIFMPVPQSSRLPIILRYTIDSLPVKRIDIWDRTLTAS